MKVLHLRQKIFLYILRTYFDISSPAEYLGTLTFAIRAHFSGEKWDFSVLNAKKIEKIDQIKTTCSAHKKNIFEKNFGFFFVT